MLKENKTSSWSFYGVCKCVHRMPTGCPLKLHSWLSNFLISNGQASCKEVQRACTFHQNSTNGLQCAGFLKNKKDTPASYLLPPYLLCCVCVHYDLSPAGCPRKKYAWISLPHRVHREIHDWYFLSATCVSVQVWPFFEMKFWSGAFMCLFTVI